jgi:hypothetical protein
MVKRSPVEEYKRDEEDVLYGRINHLDEYLNKENN